MRKPYKIQDAFWVSDDGSFGTSRILVVPIEWADLLEDADIERIDEAADSDKLQLALSTIKRRWRKYNRIQRAIRTLEKSGDITVKQYRITDTGVEQIDPE